MNRVVSLLALLTLALVAVAQKPAKSELTYPPKLPDGKECVSDKSADFLKKPDKVTLADGVTIAKEAPTIELLYYPGQTYAGNPWSA